MRLSRLRPYLAIAALLAISTPALSMPASGTRVSGHIELGVGVPVVSWNLTQCVVFLVPQGSSRINEEPPTTILDVHQRHAQFDPSFLVVRKGQTVSFINDDAIDHNVFSFSRPKKFDLGVYPKGQSKSVLFDQEGPVLIFCSVHERMSAVLYVVPSPLFTVTDAKGHFSIENVPPGKYLVRTWHTSLPRARQYVEVRSIDVESEKPVELTLKLDPTVLIP